MKHLKLFEEWVTENETSFSFGETDYTRISDRELSSTKYYEAFVEGLTKSSLSNIVADFKVEKTEYGIEIKSPNEDEKETYFYMWSDDEEGWMGGWSTEFDIDDERSSGSELSSFMSPEEFLWCLRNDRVLGSEDLKKILDGMKKYPEDLARKYNI